jgi:hypothetical protein
MAALNKKDILQGALIGGATGAITGGMGGGFGGASEGIAGLGGELAGSTIANTASNAGATAGVDALTGNATSALIDPTSGLIQPTSVLNSGTINAANPLTTAGIPAGTPSPITGTPGLSGFDAFKSDPMKYLGANKIPLAGAGLAGGMFAGGQDQNNNQSNPGAIRDFRYNQTPSLSYTGAGTPAFNQSYTPLGVTQLASGGIAALATGGSLPLGQNNMFPMSSMGRDGTPPTGQYAASTQEPVSASAVNAGYETNTDPYSGTEIFRMAEGGTPRLEMSNNYSTPNRAPSQAVVDHQNMMAARAMQEYSQPTLSAMVPNALRTTPSSAYQQPNLNPSAGLPASADQYKTLQDQIAALQQPQQYFDSSGNGAAAGGMMHSYSDGGGIYNLGGYSDGGRLLKGPGDGVSDDIPAQIGNKQPARLADGEFVVPARIVSELGNGSTDAGAKRLYQMMDRVQANRKKSVGKGRVAVDSKSSRYLPS